MTTNSLPQGAAQARVEAVQAHPAKAVAVAHLRLVRVAQLKAVLPLLHVQVAAVVQVKAALLVPRAQAETAAEAKAVGLLPMAAEAAGRVIPVRAKAAERACNPLVPPPRAPVARVQVGPAALRATPLQAQVVRQV